MKQPISQAFSIFAALFIAVLHIAEAAVLSHEHLTGSADILKTLSADNMTGRKPNTPGHQEAAKFIENTFSSLNLYSFQSRYTHKFEYPHNWGDATGRNIIGWIKGKQFSDKYIVFTAHYDHLGRKGRKIYNGADDNASGVAALLTLARHFSSNLPDHSLIFIATDAEEPGLHGAEAFLSSSLIKTEQIVLNVNVDMIGNGGNRHELYVLTSRNAHFDDFIGDYIFANTHPDFRLRFGQPRKINRESLLNSQIDWRRAGDHAAFAKKGLNYIYFGNDVHKHYHQPTDTFDNIDIAFFKSAITHIANIATQLDQDILSIQRSPTTSLSPH